MSIEFCMPSLGADMESGTLLEWKVAPGDAVKRGDVVAVVDTDKGAIDVEIFHDGTVERLLVEPGTTVPVGEPLAVIATNEAGQSVKAAAPPGPPAAPETPETVERLERRPLRSAARPRISPAARARAERLGIDIATLSGTGPEGAISLADVESAAEVAPAAPRRVDREPMRGVIAAAMARSKREIPHYYLNHTIDYTDVAERVKARNASVPIEQRILPVVPLLCAVAHAAASHAGFNGQYLDGHFEAAASVNLGVALALRSGGLVTPAIVEAEKKTVTEMMSALGDLVRRARAGRLKASELASGTLTVTSLGDEGVDSVQPIIYPPQVAIVGVGTLVERPWVVRGQVVPRQVITLTLAADHRVTDGRAGAKFLRAVEKALSEAETS